MIFNMAQTNSSQISVILCAYTEERWECLITAAQSIRRQTLAALELIVVIDHNPRLLERALVALPWALIIENRGSRGTSEAKNSAIEIAKGDILAFMDDDAVAEPDWLSRLMADYSGPEILGVGGKIEPLWQSKRPEWFPVEFDWVLGCSYKGLPTETKPVRNMIGCNMSFRKEVFQQAGGFNAAIGRNGKVPLGCEETEFCIRSARQIPGGKYLYDPAAVVHHNVPDVRTSWRYFRTRCYAEGLSKAEVSKNVGESRALISERSYTLRVLPSGVINGIKNSVLSKNSNGVRQSAAILVGLLYTTAGYLLGRAQKAFPINGKHSFRVQPEKAR